MYRLAVQFGDGRMSQGSFGLHCKTSLQLVFSL